MQVVQFDTILSVTSNVLYLLHSLKAQSFLDDKSILKMTAKRNVTFKKNEVT